MDDIYWNSILFGSEESLQESKPYVDPWDLENYAYIRSHLDSVENASDPSSSGEFVEQNSTSFYYVPGIPPPKRNNKYESRDKVRGYDSMVIEQGNYAAIDEVKQYVRRPRVEERRIRSHSRDVDFDSDSNESPYEEGVSEPLYGYGNREKIYKKLPVPIPSPRDRSLSFSYGDYGHSPRNDIYSRLDDMPMKKDATLPIYEDDRRFKRKPSIFGLSNYGHLKIDYSYSWNNLNKYICK